MPTKRTFFVTVMLLFFIAGTLGAQDVPENIAAVRFNGIELSYVPAAFGTMLPAYNEGTPFQTDAPYFANIAPHTTFTFMRPDPARPEVDLTGELRVYRLADTEAYAEPSYKDVVAQLRTLDTSDLSAFVTVGADYHIPALPFMPVLNATQVFRAQPRAFDFASVKGIEYYTYYSQAAEPILDGQVMYTYQGITTDEQYYLSFSIYIETGLLQTSIPADMDWDAFGANYAQYLQDTFDTINTADAATFSPAPDVMHSFIESISISE